MGSSIGSYDGAWAGPNTVGATAHGWVLADPRAVAPNITSDLMVSDLEISVGDPSAVLHILVGRTELSEPGGSSNGFYFRGSSADDNLPGIGGPIVDPPSYFLANKLGAYFLSGGHPLQLHYEEELEAINHATSTVHHGFAVWLKRVDSTDEVPYHINVRFEVNK